MRVSFPVLLIAASLVMSSLVVCSCGFRPLYAPAVIDNDVKAGSTLLDQVWIETIQGQSGVILRNYLLDGFYRHGYPETARYLLTINLQEFVRDVDVQKNDTTTRAQFVVLATYRITDRTTSQIIDHGQARSVAGYNILLSQYTTLVSQNDARDRVLRELSDKIQTRTALVLSDPQIQTVPVPAPQPATPVPTPEPAFGIPNPTEILPDTGLAVPASRTELNQIVSPTATTQ